MKAAFEQLQKEMGSAPLAAAIYNVGGKFVRKAFLELSQEEFEAGYEANGYVETSTPLKSTLTDRRPQTQTRSIPVFASCSSTLTEEH